MRRGVILFLIMILCTVQAFAYELVLPKDKKSYVNTNYAFFVGKANNGEFISINGLPVYTASNGAFAHSVKLKEGENRIVIKSNYSTQIYKFYKKTPASSAKAEITEFDIKPVLVKKDNTPLRSTPVDFGLNRIAHLFEDTTLLVNGSSGDFYRVFLSKDKTAWIAKKDVETIDSSSSPAQFISLDGERFKNAASQTIVFSKNIPYTIEEKDKEIVFRVFNPEFAPNSVYTLNIPKPEKYSYKVTLENGCYTFKVSEMPKSLEECTVIIDAGHGGAEKGAIGCLGDEEKDINLKIALELQEQLNAMGINTVMTRECDGDISLEDRVKIAHNNKANIFVSIHLNSIGDIPMNVHKNKGTSVYYFNPNSEALAKIVEKEVVKSAGTRADGVKTASFAVIRPSDYVGILVETAYMTNPYDSVLYKSENFAHNAASGIAKGIVEFINK